MDSPPAVTWEGAPPGDSRHAKVGAGGNLKSIAKFFLRARPWQIVLLFFVVPVLAGIAGMERISTQIRSWHVFGLAVFFFLGVMAFFLYVFLSCVVLVDGLVPRLDREAGAQAEGAVFSVCLDLSLHLFVHLLPIFVPQACTGSSSSYRAAKSFWHVLPLIHF